jgi:hypothetical protein
MSGSAGGSGRAWPVAIVIGLLVVVAVNIAFIVVAVGGADPVAESYEAGER